MQILILVSINGSSLYTVQIFNSDQSRKYIRAICHYVFVYLTKIYDLLEEEYTYQHGNVSFNVLTRTFTLERKEKKRKETKKKKTENSKKRKEKKHSFETNKRVDDISWNKRACYHRACQHSPSVKRIDGFRTDASDLVGDKMLHDVQRSLVSRPMAFVYHQ